MAKRNDNDTLHGTDIKVGELAFDRPLSNEDVMRAGEAVLSLMALAATLGHVSPNGICDYAPRPDVGDDPIGAAVWDAFAATRLDAHSRPASENMYRFVWQRGVAQALSAKIAEAMI